MHCKKYLDYLKLYGIEEIKVKIPSGELKYIQPTTRAFFLKKIFPFSLTTDPHFLCYKCHEKTNHPYKCIRCNHSKICSSCASFHYDWNTNAWPKQRFGKGLCVPSKWIICTQCDTRLKNTEYENDEDLMQKYQAFYETFMEKFQRKCYLTRVLLRGDILNLWQPDIITQYEKEHFVETLRAHVHSDLSTTVTFLRE